MFTASLGLNRLDQTVISDDYGKNYGTILGIPGLNGPDIRDSGFPDVTIGAYTQFGVPDWMPLFRHDETFTQSDSTTWTKGAHEFRFGFDLIRHHLNHWQPELRASAGRAVCWTSTVRPLRSTPAVAMPHRRTSSTPMPRCSQGLSDDVQKGVQYILMTGREWQFGWFGQAAGRFRGS